MSPLNVRDAEDAFLDGHAVFQDWLDEFQSTWERPAVRSLVAATLARIPPEIQAQLEVTNPEAFARVRQMLEEGSNGSSANPRV